MTPSEWDLDPRQLASDSVWKEVRIPGDDFPAGVPDPAVLARLANEFFTAVPEFVPVGSAVPEASSQAPPVPAAAHGRPASQGVSGNTSPTAYPTEAELRALPGILAGLPASSVPSPGGVPSLDTIPGDFATISFSDAPSFGFLEEARPIFAAATT